MSTRQRLMEQYEDALFAVIMNEIMIEEGKELIEARARMKADLGFSVPEGTNRRCLKAIARAFGKQKLAHAAHTAWRLFQRVSVAAFVAMLLFTGVCAAFPSVRDAALNLLIGVSDLYTDMRFGEEKPQGDVSVEPTVAGIYEFSVLPDGFVLTDSGGNRLTFWKTYSSEIGAEITLNVIDGSDDTIHRFDTENMNNVQNIEVNGNSGQLAVKDGLISATLVDETHHIFINVACQGMSQEDMLNILSGLVYTE